MLSVERDFLVHGFRFTPYGSAEVFYDGAKHSWHQEWYTAGIEWPYKRLVRLDTYYRRENCDTCKPTNWNAGGVTLNFFFREYEVSCRVGISHHSFCGSGSHCQQTGRRKRLPAQVETKVWRENLVTELEEKK
jgi:hypothetical protein